MRLMNLTVRIDNNAYAPGDTITGIVDFNLDYPKTIIGE